MTVLDAACVIALFRGEPGAAQVAELITAGTAMSVVNRAEVLDRLVRQGANSAEVIADIDMLGLDTHDVTGLIADRAGLLRATHYHGTRCPVSLSDCIAAATASHLGVPLATSDQALIHLAGAIAVSVVAVANSAGHRPLTSGRDD